MILKLRRRSVSLELTRIYLNLFYNSTKVTQKEETVEYGNHATYPPPS